MFHTFELAPNHVLRISPDMTIAIGINVIAPGQDTVSGIAEMVAPHLPRADEMDAYERELGDAMPGDATLFAREDYVEEAWRIVDPVLKTHTPVHEYEPGTWGPKEVDARVSPLDGWQNPIVKKPWRSKCSPMRTGSRERPPRSPPRRRGRPSPRAVASSWP
jgi:glucose-6-phosphate 1-dehydrogenase